MYGMFMSVWFFKILCTLMCFGACIYASDEQGAPQEVLTPRTKRLVTFEAHSFAFHENQPVAHNLKAVRAQSNEHEGGEQRVIPSALHARRVFSAPAQPVPDINEGLLQMCQFEERAKRFERLGKTYFLLPTTDSTEAEKIVYTWQGEVFSTLKLSHVFDGIEASSCLRRTHILLFLCEKMYSVSDEQRYLKTIPGFSRSASHRIEHFTQTQFRIPGSIEPYIFSWQTIDIPHLSDVFASISKDFRLDPLYLQCMIGENIYGDSSRFLRLSRIPGFYQKNQSFQITLIDAPPISSEKESDKKGCYIV